MKPIAFMTAFMKNLVDLGDDKDKYEKTIKLLTPYENSQAIVDAIHSDITSASSPIDFLTTKCGIDLDNADVGGLLGYDTSGNTAITAVDVLNETGIPLITPPSTSVIINNFNITFPAMSLLTEQGQFIVKALYSWWYPLAFKTIKDGYGLSIVDSSYVKTMDTDLFNQASSNGSIKLAYVETRFSLTTGIPVALSCRINMNEDAYGNIDTSNPNGYAPVLGTNYLDRTLLHELTHALMSTNIQWFASELPSYFKEGTAELINGCDDTRATGILSAVTTVSIFDDGLTETPTNNLDWYTTGYIFLRYVIKQTLNYKPILSDGFMLPSIEIFEDTVSAGIRFEHGKVRYGNFRAIFIEYMDFIQRTSDTVPAWKRCEGSDFDSFKGATFRIPLDGATSIVKNNIASITLGNTPKFSISDKSELTTPCYYLSINYNKNFDYNSYVTDRLANLDFYNITEIGNVYSGMINSGEFVPFVLHTLYDENLCACEQGGSSGKRLFDYNNHTETYPDFGATSDTNDANLMRSMPPKDDPLHPHAYHTLPPPIPGTGSPWLTYSASDSVTYPTIEFYFTKTKYNSTITLNYYNETDESIVPIWSNVSLGVMDIDEESYKFPLYICGGTTALRPKQLHSTYPDTSTPVWMCGNVYNLDIKQNNLSSSNLLYPVRLDHTNITNSMLLGPDGIWKYVYNYTQGLDRIVDPYTLSSSYPEYCILPTNLYINDSGKSVVYPTISDNQNVWDVYNSDSTISDELIPVSLLANNDKNNISDELGISGSLPNIYASKDYTHYGMITKNSTRYVVIPNGWKERVPYYKHFDYNGYTDISIQIMGYLEEVKKYDFSHALVIKVGEVS